MTVPAPNDPTLNLTNYDKIIKRHLPDLEPKVQFSSGRYIVTLFRAGRQVAQFALAPMPGCCGYIVSTGTWVIDSGKGIGQKLQGLKFELGRALGYSVMIATTTEHNKAENHILRKHGWQQVGKEYVNANSGNTLLLWQKYIRE